MREGRKEKLTRPAPPPARVAPVSRFGFEAGGRWIDLSARTLVMGIVNCTPDSFYAGSRVPRAEDAVAAGLRMVEEGADLLDVGGESTRPGSDPVDADEEARRVVPVIRELARRSEVPISVDTTRASTARAALEAGACIVNDVSALRFDESLAEVVRESGAGLILMHMKGRPRDMQTNPVYDDVVRVLVDFFDERLGYCHRAGIARERIVLDPGIGFGKTAEHNYQIIRRLEELAVHERPLLLGPSRKSFLGRVLGLPPEERLEGTAAAVAVGICQGADIVRVHDVKEMVRVARVADALAGRTAVGE